MQNGKAFPILSFASQISYLTSHTSLIPHLFRTEFSKITAVLCKLLGVEHMQLAEDIASETFLAALESWSYSKLPPNPTAWLYTVAKNKAKNHIHRNNLFAGKISAELKHEATQAVEIDIDLSEQNITDSQLQMLFAICHPSIPQESQVGLALRILCGFGIDEIATAFLTNKETINKRLVRAREKLRTEQVKIEFPGEAEVNKRLDTVLATLYLVFSEGYYSESQDNVLNEELCLEAIRLNWLLIENELTNTPGVNALFALMCFHASRFKARKEGNGEIVLYQDQDETLWNRELIAKGAYHLHMASQGPTLSKYHIEAHIAYWHTIKEDTKEKWESILQLYNSLLRMAYSSMAALNRTFALAKANGKEEAIIEAQKLKLEDNHLYHVLLAELYEGVDNTKVKAHLQTALSLTKSESEKKLLSGRIEKL